MGKKDESIVMAEVVGVEEEVAAKDVEGSRSSAGVSPETKASFLSLLFFGWVSKLLSKGRSVRKKENRELEMEDLWDLPEKDETGNLSKRYAKLQEVWLMKRKKLAQEELGPKETASQLTNTMWKIIKRDIIVAGFYKLGSVAALLGYPLMLFEIIARVQTLAVFPEEEKIFSESFLFVGVFGAMIALNSIFQNRYNVLVLRSGWQVRSILTTNVYRKTLRISAASRQSMTAGEIVNLMQLDAEGVSRVTMMLHEIWSAPVQLIGYLMILYMYIDWATFVSLAVIFAAVPFVAIIFSKLIAYQKEFAIFADKRVLQINEVLQSMQGVKMGGWELKFAQVIGVTRKQELDNLRGFAIVLALGFGVMLSIPTLAAVASLSAFALAELGQNDPATLFAALNAFGLLRQPVMAIPGVLATLSEGVIRRRRLATFLSLKEVVSEADEDDESIDEEEDQSTIAVQITDGQFYWADPAMKPAGLTDRAEAGKKQSRRRDRKAKKTDESADDIEAQRKLLAYTIPALDNINIEIRKGSLVGVCGPVASGKSSLCAAIINEMHKEKGDLRVNGTIAYAAQTPWIFHATVRENILFGTPFDENRYQTVLQACQLARDLELLDNGDQTEVGEQGINLSGGQKARISLARAAYSKNNIVILDDPLSALDPGVSSKVFEQCILGLLKGRTCILVTNQLNLLPKCDTVIALSSGTILEQGRYSVLKRSGLEFAKILLAYNGGEEEKEKTKTTGITEEELVAVVNSGGKGEDIMEKEERAKGAVALSSYIFYAKAGGLCGLLLVLLVSFIMQGTTLGSQAWVTAWSDDILLQFFTLYTYLGVYGALGVGTLITTSLQLLIVLFYGIGASKRLHKNLLTSVLRAPMSFFDSTPTGRIIARFSKDMVLVDRQLAQVLNGMIFLVLGVVVAIGTISYVTPVFLLMLPVLGPLYILILQYFRPTMRDVKRIESITRSPIYSHFSESISGLTTIRAYDSTGHFVQANTTKVDMNIKAWYLLKHVELWLFVRLGVMGSVITIGAGVFSVYSARTGTVSPGEAALSLTYAIQITDMLGGMVRIVSEVEAAFNAVERIQYYTKKLPQEKPLTSKKPPPKSWPKHGKIEINNLFMRYKPSLPFVLKGLTLTFQGGERIGIVGRTGCGKSSLMLALMRLVEPEPAEDGSGPVVIDDIDVSKIGLHELRSKIGIVPQNPMLFSGTIRSNLDPFDAYDDEKLWAALESCALKDAVVELGGLDSKVSEFGENMSQGQRQLLVLSRALLNDTRILLLDEATSSLDHATDAAIQATLRKNFANSTCITIAHRLETVADSDKILVLDSGSIVEYDAPAILLKDKRSTFSKMVNELGASMAAKLRRAARVSLARSISASSQEAIENSGDQSE